MSRTVMLWFVKYRKWKQTTLVLCQEVFDYFSIVLFFKDVWRNLKMNGYHRLIHLKLLLFRCTHIHVWYYRILCVGFCQKV